MSINAVVCISNHNVGTKIHVHKSTKGVIRRRQSNNDQKSEQNVLIHSALKHLIILISL